MALEQHPRGENLHVSHACPECPTPLAALRQLPRPLCPWCHGGGLVDEATLTRWQYVRWQEWAAA